MGLLPAGSDRCTYVSYTDVKKKKVKQVARASGDSEATQSFEQTGHPLDEVSYHEVYDDILQQLMETDEYDKLRVWTSEVERRDIYLTAKKTSRAWGKGDHAQDCGCGLEQGDTGEVHWRQGLGNLKEKIDMSC